MHQLITIKYEYTNFDISDWWLTYRKRISSAKNFKMQMTTAWTVGVPRISD